MPKIAKNKILSRGKRPVMALLMCTFLFLLSGCIKRSAVVDPPSPPAVNHNALIEGQK
jgi:hypothetical protein